MNTANAAREEIKCKWKQEKNPKGIECDHWVMKPPSVPTHGIWCAFRKDSGAIFRIFSMDVTNPLMIPILGSYYITSNCDCRRAVVSPFLMRRINSTVGSETSPG